MAVTRYAKLTFSTDQRTGGWVSTSRTRDLGSSRPGRTGRRDQNIGAQHDIGGAVDQRFDVVPRPWLKCCCAGLDAGDELAHLAAAFLEAQPRVALAPLLRIWLLDVPVANADCGDSAGVAVQLARRQQRVDEPESEPGRDRGRLELRVELKDDRVERDKGTRRVQIEQLIGEFAAAFEHREARLQALARSRRVGLRRELDVVLVDLGGARLDRSALVAAEGAAEHLLAGRVRARVPDVFVHDDRPTARRATRREELLDHAAELDVTARVGRNRGESGVEVAQVGRA